MTPEIPEGWEKCAVLCATKVMLATSDNLFDFENLGSSIRLSSGSLIRIADMDWLGITPVRKVKVEPIEFTVEAHRDSGHIYGTYALYPPFQYGNLPEEWIGKTFREVIE